MGERFAGIMDRRHWDKCHVGIGRVEGKKSRREGEWYQG